MLRAVECGMRLESDFWCLRGQFGVPFGYLLGTFWDLLGVQMAPKTVQTAFQELPELQRGSKDLSSGPKVVPKWLPGGPKRLPGGPNRAAKRPPGGPQEAPRGPLMPQMVPERVPRAPKMPPRGLQTSKNAIIVALPELAAQSWLLLTRPFEHSRLL